MNHIAMTLQESARGRWPSILGTLGIDVRTDGRHSPCPACGGKDRFRFDDQDGRGTWFCNQCDPQAGDGLALVRNVRKCDLKTAAQLAQDALGGPSPHRPHTKGEKINGAPLKRPVTIRTTPPEGIIGKTLFLYADDLGHPRFYVQRIEKNGVKKFPQWGPSADGEGWQPNMEHVKEPRPLYRLTDILANPEALVIFHEGEKAVECHLAAFLPGCPTTSSQGAGKAKYTVFSVLAGRHVVIIPDNDKPGEQHAQDLAALAYAAGAASVKILRLPSLPPKGDVVEWVAAGGTPEAFSTLLETAEVISPPQAEQLPVAAAPSASQAVPAFPLEALPPILQQFVMEQAAALPVPVDLIAIPALVAAGAAIGRTREVLLKPGWTEHPSIYAAIVSPTGSLKTPALHKPTEPLRARQQDYVSEYKRAREQYEADQAAYMRAMTAYKNGNDGVLPSKPSPPICPRSWTADVTIEKLGTMLAENPRGVAIIRDELTAWMKSMNQYRGGKGADKQFYLSAWSGIPVTVDRQGKDGIFIARPFLSVVGCMTPDGLADLHDEQSGEDGSIPRILFSYPEPVKIRWSEAIVSPVAQDAYNNLFATLHKLTMVMDPLTGEERPMALPLTPQAKAFFIEWHDEHCQEAESCDGPFLPGLYSKLKGYCARLALIHALCLDPGASAVGLKSISAASDLIEYFVGHFTRIAPMLSRRRITEEAKWEADILRLLPAGTTLTKRELQRKLPRCPAKVFNTVLDALLKAERIEKVEKAGSRRTLEGLRLTEG